MTKDEVRLTYRLSKELYDRIEASAKKKHISVNAEINWVLHEYYEYRKQNGGR